MRVAFVEWPDGLTPEGPKWAAIERQVGDASPDILVTNEMPFGTWLAATPAFDARRAAQSVALHERGIDALRALKAPLILSSRPVFAAERLANEGFALAEGRYRFLHQKHYFPAEPGWREADWFTTGKAGFDVASFGALTVGMLLCTELMFNERARAYGKDGAHLIVVPRATGTRVDSWRVAGAMGALASGAYLISSNRVGSATPSGPEFGGGGLAFAPDGQFIAETSKDASLVVVEIDLEAARRQKLEYPCYVPEV